MTWRHTQLENQLCDQDQLILGLFNNQSVRYIGNDVKFAEHLVLDNTATNLILILNDPIWISDLYHILHKNLIFPITNFYIGINRYHILGNDTTIVIENLGQAGANIIQVVDKIISKLNFKITKHGTHDNDLGRHFNFVQPLTWAYGSHVTNSST
tara:strand:- start:1168 stop:1632 length:465 start_codon:yes stop_codon:yes gene_type:complete